jgi:hypothetical protein
VFCPKTFNVVIGAEGVKWELGVADGKLAWKMGLHALGLGFIINKKKLNSMGMGLRFEQDSHCYSGFRALGHWELVEIWAGGKWE